jgi:hypothetical protein
MAYPHFIAQARAAFILDDFDDPAEIMAPAMQGIFIETQNVGDLQGKRRIRIASIQGNPEGFLDSNLTTRSTLSASITRLNPLQNGATLAAIQSDYAFAPADFSERGSSNAIFFDFREVRSELPPSLFLLLLHDGSDIYRYVQRPFPMSDQPFTIAIPFEAFTFRDGGPGTPDFTSIRQLNFELRASQIAGGGPDPLNFFMQLDRIRVGRIPEPSSFALFVGGVMALVRVKRRRPIGSLRRMKRCDLVWPAR